MVVVRGSEWTCPVDSFDFISWEEGGLEEDQAGAPRSQEDAGEENEICSQKETAI